MGRHVERRRVPLSARPIRELRPGGRLAGCACAGRLRQGVDNSLWVGTDGGLVRFKKPRFTVYTQRDGLASDLVGSIFQDGEGSVWAETGHGLTRFVNGAFRVLTANDGLPDRSGQARQEPPIASPGVHELRPGSLDARSLRSGRERAGHPVGSRNRRPRGSLRHAVGRHPRRRADSRSRRPRHSPDGEGWPGRRFRVVALRRSSRKSLGRNPPKRRDPNLGRTDDVMVRHAMVWRRIT